ncbi:hypothetical protein BV25DRAFT_1912598 [Artomyces pyxidatus]|uniref:Uncharacterized protein n=1 Tax=Artomyces pyxidatus TaxID=48021 RepID=A0ACB8TDN5_9AGAM|nr:hypothetical protein BV25DRAFT_1912598 [Artomyces pyxidatus]
MNSPVRSEASSSTLLSEDFSSSASDSEAESSACTQSAGSVYNARYQDHREFPLLSSRARMSMKHTGFRQAADGLFLLHHIPPLPGARPIPHIFTTVGCIIPEDCYMTIKGDVCDSESQTSDSAVREPCVASCWLEAPEGKEEQFLQVLCEVQEAANRVGDTAYTSELLLTAQGRRSALLQVGWWLHSNPEISAAQPRAPPLFNQSGQRYTLNSLSDVPIGRPVVVMFMLWHDEIMPKEKTVVGAGLLGMRLL